MERCGQRVLTCASETCVGQSKCWCMCAGGVRRTLLDMGVTRKQFGRLSPSAGPIACTLQFSRLMQPLSSDRLGVSEEEPSSLLL